MDTLKKINPFGGNQSSQESGQEPVSGQQGDGTATRPFDEGNREDDPELGGKSAQHADPTSQSKSQSGQEPISGKQGEGTATAPFDAGNRVDDPELGGKAPQHTTSGDVTPTRTSSHQYPASKEPLNNVRDATTQSHASAAENSSSSAPKLVKNPTIGSSRWFTNPDPFAERADDSEEPVSEQTASKPEEPSVPSIKSEAVKSSSPSPPNHLGEDVPPGQCAIVHEPAGLQQSGNLDRGKGKGKGKAAMVEDTLPAATEASSAISNQSERIRPESIVTDYTYPTAGTDASTIASSSRRSSTVMNIPHSKGMPITAGGVPIGFRAMQDRERRFSSIPIYEHPEQDYHAQTKSTDVSKLPKTQDAARESAAKITPTTDHSGKKVDAVTTDEPVKKQTTTETPVRRMSVIQKAKSFGRKVRHSIAN